MKKCVEIDSNFKELVELKVDKLYPKGIEVRYPEFTATVSEEETKEAIEIAEKVREFVSRKLVLGMRDKPLVSIVIPTYNSEKTLVN